MTMINPDGLFGDELSRVWQVELAGCTDGEGYTDYEDLDYTLGQIEQEQRDLEARADVLAVYAEEVLRFS